MVGIIKNSYLKHILNRMTCEFRGGCEVIGRMDEKHVRADHKLLWCEPLWKQMHRHHERRV